MKIKQPRIIYTTWRLLAFSNINLGCEMQVMGRSSPNDKLLLVQALRKNGDVVAVTGDGTNDAPALHEVL